MFVQTPPRVIMIELYIVVYCLIQLVISDIFITKAKWFFIHAIANIHVAIYAFPHVIAIISNPNIISSSSSSQPSSIDDSQYFFTMMPLYMVFILHVYHIIRFFHTLTDEDLFHHFIFIPFVCIPGIIVATLSPNVVMLINFIAFFMNGLPGGITYFMLVMVKHDLIPRHVEKQITMWINNYIRMPGLLFAVFLIYCNKVYSVSSDDSSYDFGDAATFIEIILKFVTMLIAYNAIYYNTLSVWSYSRHADHQKIEQIKKGAAMLISRLGHLQVENAIDSVLLKKSE